MTTLLKGIRKAARVAGGQSALARKLKLTPQAVQYWTQKGLPAERVIEVEAATGVPRAELRPDLYC